MKEASKLEVQRHERTKCNACKKNKIFSHVLDCMWKQGLVSYRQM